MLSVDKTIKQWTHLSTTEGTVNWNNYFENWFGSPKVEHAYMIYFPAIPLCRFITEKAPNNPNAHP
jgi:hypothetical protein